MEVDASLYRQYRSKTWVPVLKAISAREIIAATFAAVESETSAAMMKDEKMSEEMGDVVQV